MLKFYRNVLAAGAVALGLAACGDKVTVTSPPTPTPTVHSVTVVPASVTINVSQTVAFVASVVADSGLSNAVTWTSSNPAVATVSATGVVTGVATGTTTIIATSNADGTKTGAGAVTVVALPPGITGFSVAPQTASLGLGFTVQATTSIQPAGAQATIAWSSSNTAVATVSATGLITGVSAGSAIITATATVGTTTASATVGVTVVATAPPGVVSFNVSPTTMSLAPAQASQATATVQMLPGFTAPAVTWTSLTPAIATVSNTGVVTGVAQGTTAVTASITGGGVTLTQSIAVNVGAAASVSINSITAGATAGVGNCAGVVGAPVVLTNVNCQIDVNLNFDPGVQKIDSVTVWFTQGTTTKKLARQAFGATIPAGGIVTLSVNTANFSKNQGAGTATVDLWNGPTTVTAQVWPTLGVGGSAVNCQIGAGNNAPTCDNKSIVLTNTDGWSADVNKCANTITPAATCPAAVVSVGAGGNHSTGGFAIDNGGSGANQGKTYWGGPGVTGQITAELYSVVYNDNPNFAPGSSLNRCANQAGNGTACISNVNWAIGSTILGCPAVTQANTPTPTVFVQSFGTSGAGLTDNCSGHENILSHRDNVIVYSGALDAQSNVYPTGGLIPNTVVFGATPDSFRLDWNGPSAVQRPTGEGWEEQHWVNASWAFNHDGTNVQDNGVGPSVASWTAFVGPAYTTVIHTGADLAETNTNTSDAYTARATATDLLGNGSNSAVNTPFGVDKTSPSIRYSATAAPSSYTAAIYTGGGNASVLDSTTYNAIQGLYGANVNTAGAKDLFLAAAIGTNDSFRIEALDSRSGLYRGIETVNRFAQGGATGTVSSVVSVNFTIFDAPTLTSGFLPATIDGWLPLHAEGVTGGSALPGYYTSMGYVVDQAGNASGCPVSRAADGANGGACTASAPGGGNLFARRTLALDPGQPQVTGVSPNNNYTGNQPETFTLGSQNDLEVIDAALRLQYPNLTIGDPAGTIPAAPGLVWTYALSNTVLSSSPNGNTFAGPASGTGANIGYFLPIALRFDNSIVNPSLTQLRLDMFTTNVQETCTGVEPAAGTATGPTASCGTAPQQYVGDPIPTGDVPLTIPNNVGVQVRDVFGSWIFNVTASAVTGVSNEFVSPILSATVQTPATTYSATYYDPGLGQSCPAGGQVQPAGSPTCVSGGINFRADNTLSTAGTKVFRATEKLSESLPIFTRADLYGLNALSQWVFIARINVPNPVSVGAACPATTPSSTGVVGCDNGLERYWLYTFTNVPGAPFTQYRAIGVDATGAGLASTIHN